MAGDLGSTGQGAARRQAEAPRGAVVGLGAFEIRGRAFLAPMAGVTDLGMRRIARRWGAGLAPTEMVTGDSLALRQQESLLRAAGIGTPPHVVQIAGCEARAMAEGARMAESCGADAIDINMGCPAKRVTGGAAGAALMRDLDAATRLIAATVAAVAIPVTVKMRLGWDAASLNAPELAARAEREGVRLVTVHGRTRCQFYDGKADWGAVAAVKRRVSIPVVVNGDCGSPEDAAAMLRLSGADAVMIGRAALGRPWWVGQIAAFLRDGVLGRPPSLAERRAMALEHYDAILGLFGTRKGIRHARKHLAAYAQVAGAADLRLRLTTSEDAREVARVLGHVFDRAFDRAGDEPPAMAEAPLAFPALAPAEVAS